MRKTRDAYHYAIRQVRRNENDIVKRKFAEAVLVNNSRDFWYEAKKQTSTRCKSFSSVVFNVAGCYAIANHFAEKYDELYSSVAYDECEMGRLKKEVEDKL